MAQLPSGICAAENTTCEPAGDNLLGVVDGVSSVDECRVLCEDSVCQYFSYFGPSRVAINKKKFGFEI